MGILTGRYGKISYDPAGTGGVGLVELISMNTWSLSEEQEFEDVSCFGNTNRVYIPGLIDISGELGGFWDSSEVTLWEAAIATTPGMLSLQPNENEPTFKWEGLGYLDASIDCSLSAPTVSSNFRAAGNWTTPGSAALLAA